MTPDITINISMGGAEGSVTGATRSAAVDTAPPTPVPLEQITGTAAGTQAYAGVAQGPTPTGMGAEGEDRGPAGAPPEPLPLERLAAMASAAAGAAPDALPSPMERMGAAASRDHSPAPTPHDLPPGAFTGPPQAGGGPEPIALEQLTSGGSQASVTDGEGKETKRPRGRSKRE